MGKTLVGTTTLPFTLLAKILTQFSIYSLKRAVPVRRTATPLPNLTSSETLTPVTYQHKHILSKDQMPDVSQEWMTEGLAEVSACEYGAEITDVEMHSNASDTVQRVVEGEPEEQREVSKLFAKLSSKLDSLSSLLFTPNTDGLKPEVFVNQNVKSIMVEETVPEGISEGNILVPHEVFDVDKGSVKGEAELTKMNLKSKRRANKDA